VKTKDFDTSVLSPCQIIAWNLGRARRSRGWTQEEAAEKLEPYLGYRLSRAAWSQAERCLYGKLRRFDADEIVAFARAFEVPVSYFFAPSQAHFLGKIVMVNGRPGNPRARVTSTPITRQHMLMLAQGLPDGQIKTVRRGRPPWVAPDLAQVQAAAERGQNMKQIAGSLGVHPATFYRKKQHSREFNESVEIGREKRAVATTIALYETEVPVSPRELDQRSAILFYLKTHPVWGHRYDTTVKTSVDTPPGGRYPSAEELKLIQAMTAQERQEIDAICERARQRLSHPEVKATTQAVGQDPAMEGLKTPRARGLCRVNYFCRPRQLFWPVRSPGLMVQFVLHRDPLTWG